MTDRLRQIDNQHVWHPFTPMSAHREENVPIIESGEGFFLNDVEGKQYLDGISSLWCNIHGHRVPEIDAAIQDQLTKVGHSTTLGLANVPSIKLAEQLVARTPEGLNKVFYSDSGATAVEIALKLAYQYQAQRAGSTGPRKLFACMSNAYHGDTVGTVSVGGIQLFHSIYSNLLFETVQVPSPVTYRTPDGYDAESWISHCFDEMERIIVENKNELAAFVIEPLVQGAAGILVHHPGFLKRARELTRENDVLLIVDEVAVGFGRTGTMFACEQEDVRPDIICLAKGITGGYLPLAATLTTDEIFDAFLAPPEECKTFYHGHTYTGNPLGCAAALASLQLMDDNKTLENVAVISQQISERLASLADHPHVGEIRQKGAMVGIELVANKKTKQPYPAEKRMGHQVTLAARKRNTILRPLGDVVVLMPAPAMPVELVGQLCDVAIESIDEVTG